MHFLFQYLEYIVKFCNFILYNFNCFITLPCLYFSDLIHCTNEPNVSVPELCNFLIQRTQQSSWVMVFKSLITAHHLMCYGNEVSFDISIPNLNENLILFCIMVSFVI